MKKLILFFKAEQGDLFDKPVNVKAGVRKGKAVKAYTRIQKVAQHEGHWATCAHCNHLVSQHEKEGMSTSDAQGVAMAEHHKIKPLEHPVKAENADSSARQHEGHWANCRHCEHLVGQYEQEGMDTSDAQGTAMAEHRRATAPTGRFTVTIPKVGKVSADSIGDLGDAAWKAVHEAGNGGYGASEVGSGWPVTLEGKPIGTLRYNGRFDAADKAAQDAVDIDSAKNARPDPDAAAMQRYAEGVRAEEDRVLKSPEHKAAVAQSEAEVAKLRAPKPRVGTSIVYMDATVLGGDGGRILGRVVEVDGNICWYRRADGSSSSFIWRHPDGGLNTLHDWPGKGEYERARAGQAAIAKKVTPTATIPRDAGEIRYMTPIVRDGFTIAGARYAHGKVLVQAPSTDGYQTRASRLVEAVGGHYTHREKGYTMSPAAAERLMAHHDAGHDASAITGVINDEHGNPLPKMAVFPKKPKGKKTPTKPMPSAVADDDGDDEPEGLPRIGEKPDRYGGAKVPDVDFDSRDLQDSGKRVTEATILKDYGPKNGKAVVYQATVPMSDIPSPILAEEQDDEYADGEGYDWSEYTGRSTFPPVKLGVSPEGKIHIIDGNHRLKWWEDNNYTHAPAWVIDERPGVRDE